MYARLVSCLYVVVIRILILMFKFSFFDRRAAARSRNYVRIGIKL